MGLVRSRTVRKLVVLGRKSIGVRTLVLAKIAVRGLVIVGTSLVLMIGTTRSPPQPELIRPEDFDRCPYFIFKQETTAEVAGRAAVPLTLLLVTAAIANIAGCAWMIGYPVTN